MVAPSSLILNVDADAARRSQSSNALRMAGFNVREAATGQSALEQVEASTGLVLLDARLPDLPGHEVCRRIKTAPATREVLVMCLSDAPSRDLAEAGGADVTLTAPVALDALVAQARVLLRLRRAEREVHTLSEEIRMLGHELRNPLNVISLSAQQLQRQGLGEVQASLNARVLTSARRMERMIHQFLDFARVRMGGELSVERVPGDLHALIRQCMEELRASYPDRELVLETVGDGQGAWDADRLGQVMGNLVTNAFKYGAAGRPVRVQVEATGQEVLLRVHNDGAPIPSDEQPHLFDAYRRAARTRRVRGKDSGLGLGLSITWHVVRAHGGMVEVSSSEESGTTFTVRLPR